MRLERSTGGIREMAVRGMAMEAIELLADVQKLTAVLNPNAREYKWSAEVGIGRHRFVKLMVIFLPFEANPARWTNFGVAYQLFLAHGWFFAINMSSKMCAGQHSGQQHRNIPESLLREDDVYYETVRTFVEKGVGVSNIDKERCVTQGNVELFNSPSIISDIFSLLDDMTNKGLCQFAEIVTGSSTKFEKARRKMKKIIKEHLPKVLRSSNDNQQSILREVKSLLKDPHNFRKNCVTPLNPASPSRHAAVIKVLDGLGDLSSQTLGAMHRKLRDVQGYVPQLLSPKSGWGRDELIRTLRKSCEEMLLVLDENDVLPEPLAKAMAVAGLNSKLGSGCGIAMEFKKFSPDIMFLQNEIIKAIWLLNKKMRFSELKNLQPLLDPDAKVPKRSLRSAIRNLLTEYLFECSDMDTIPECVLESIVVINKSSQFAPCKYFSEKEIEEEVECILSVSAQTKQIVLDLMPEKEFDQDFADAYMEDFEECDDGDVSEDDELQVERLHNSRFNFDDSDGLVESMGETSPTISGSSAKRGGCSAFHTSSRQLDNQPDSVHMTAMDSVDVHGSPSSPCLESKLNDKSMDRNQDQSCSMRNFGSTNFHSHLSTANQNGYSPSFLPDGIEKMNYVDKKEPIVDSTDTPNFVSSDLYGKANFMYDNQSMRRNPYLTIQEASDGTSLAGYRLIGCMLDKFAQIEGIELDTEDVSYLRGCDPIKKVAKEDQSFSKEDASISVMFEVLEELMPSFPQSGKERLKELMGVM
ncbi:hypothetical protein RJ639_005791 [Escallonia herrerae]|uniref:Uncharacterized protein n=1 Tax=Escallonia herrerae TaxID=1293975 RepID=A0AA88VUS0_9ASTE|nr:hypothetical protein RJ639_005791 [Escallonia herrerae]